MTLSAVEQYLLELINRARLDPLAEAARLGIDLNSGLASGALNGSAKQVLAPNQMLEDAATAHSLWMIQTDVFSHTGTNGSQPWDRAAAQGYSYTTIGENIAFSGTTAASFDLVAAIEGHHDGLFRSAGHRLNLLNDSFQEVGLGRETGAFTYGSTTYNASLLTEVFGTSGAKAFLTGVAYDDADGNKFYSVGEGIAGVSLTSGSTSYTTDLAGGYAIALAASANTAVVGMVGNKSFSLTVDLSGGNVKLDVASQSMFLTSGNIVLNTGVDDATLLGVETLSLTGSSANNDLYGNKSANLIKGMAGQDFIRGGAGSDRLEGGDGTDEVYGDAGRDMLFGGTGNDSLIGGVGDDRLFGDTGDDAFYGGAGADRFVFRPRSGVDVIHDFSLSQSDNLMFSAGYWRNVTLTTAQVVDTFAEIRDGDVVFDFGTLGSVRLEGVSSLDALSSALVIG